MFINSSTPVLLAAENGYEAVVKLLLAKAGVSLDSKDSDSRTPLSLAASMEQKWWVPKPECEAVMELLLASTPLS
jgi:ankyrin repeat protein